MKTINRKIIHPELTIFHKNYTDDGIIINQNVEQISKKEIIKNINSAKNFLLKEKKFKKGDKVVLGTTRWPEFIVWFFAVSELGGSFLVSDSPSLYNSKIINYRLSLYGKIDHFIFKYNDNPSFDSLKDIFIDEQIYKNYEIDDKVSELYLCEPDDVLLYSTSSGTTGTPKVIKHTHEFFYNLMDRNAKVFNLHSTDKCLHTKNLHHGSVLGVYFLPTIKYCANHFWQLLGPREKDWDQVFLDFFETYEINRILLFYSIFDDLSRILKSTKSKNKLKIGVLTGVEQKYIDFLVGECDHEIISIFGCTETSGPLFLLNYNKDNYNQIKPNNFGTPLDDFYEIKLNDENLLTVKTYNDELTITGDRFSIIDGDYYHIRRESGAKINQTPIYLDLLAESLCSFPLPDTGVNLNKKMFDLCFDSANLKIYMRSDIDLDLKAINEYISNELKTDDYRISCIITGPRDQYITGIKFDSEKLRIESRELLLKASLSTGNV